MPFGRLAGKRGRSVRRLPTPGPSVYYLVHCTNAQERNFVSPNQRFPRLPQSLITLPSADQMAIELPARQLTVDRCDRPLGSLRISVIDRCDLRCAYCMPEEDYTWLPRQDILTFDEIERAVEAFSAAGARRVRLTGGEPLLRTGLVDLVGRLAANEGVDDLAITTNATQLAQWAVPLKDAGLQRITVSLDTLNPARFETLTRRAVLDRVIGGIREASRVGFSSLKINAVVMRGFNDDEIVDLLEFGRDVGAEVRFIEYMDVGGATLWSLERVMSKEQILEQIRAHYGADVEALGGRSSAPAERFRLPDGTVFGIVTSTTEPFCGSCDRSRLTADGMWYLCLYARDGVDLGEMLRAGASPTELTAKIRRVWQAREDRGAEDRLADPTRGALYQLEELKQNPHREMHTRGG
jgi:cyclic pyranopterin phosphate synthase